MDVTIRKGFTEKTCGYCGVIFFIPDELENECFHNGKSWTCPNGHSRVYKESEAAKYQRLYEAKKAEAERLRTMVLNRDAHLADLVKKVDTLQSKKKKTGKGK